MKRCMPDPVLIHAMNVSLGSRDSADVLHTSEQATNCHQPAMLRVRASSGRAICTIDPADRRNGEGRVFDDLAVTVSSHLGVPASRISIHPVDEPGQTPLNPTTTWADCKQLVAAGSYELMAPAPAPAPASPSPSPSPQSQPQPQPQPQPSRPTPQAGPSPSPSPRPDPAPAPPRPGATRLGGTHFQARPPFHPATVHLGGETKGATLAICSGVRLSTIADKQESLYS